MNLLNLCKRVKINVGVKACRNLCLVTEVQLLNFKTCFFYTDIFEMLPWYTDDYVHAVIIFYL